MREFNLSKTEIITFDDKRSKKMVYLSHCLLNQNSRYPGIATHKGSIIELVDLIIEAGIGIEQLPCLECLGWGGVSRKSIFKFLPTIRRFSHSKLFPVIKFFGQIWYWHYKRLCKKIAKTVAKEFEDFKNSGYNIIGIIAMDDSPTCGITQTIDLLDITFNYEDYNIELEDLEHPMFEKMQKIIPKLLKKGQGTFMHHLISRLKKMKIDIKLMGFNPWHNPLDELDKIKKNLYHPD